uniref:Cytochrome c oxidase subunit 5C n=2 Tax=Kalanchoe fedtschenkoi TaxID=63787 RepID=A0A7N0VII2_KALFE
MCTVLHRMLPISWMFDAFHYSWKMSAHKVAHATLKGPSVVKELCIGAVLGLMAGGLWKMHHWNEQRKVRAFYDMLDKGEISVVVEEE